MQVQEGVVEALCTGGISSPMIKDVISRWVLILLLKDWSRFLFVNDWVKSINSTLRRRFISSFKVSLLVFPFSIHTKLLLSSVQWTQTMESIVRACGLMIWELWGNTWGVVSQFWILYCLKESATTTPQLYLKGEKKCLFIGFSVF